MRPIIAQLETSWMSLAESVESERDQVLLYAEQTILHLIMISFYNCFKSITLCSFNLMTIPISILQEVLNFKATFLKSQKRE